MKQNTCAVTTCPRPRRRRDWCAGHYDRWRRTGDVMAEVPFASKPKRNPTCTYDGCSEPHLALGYCMKHHARLRKNGDPSVKTTKVRTKKTCTFDTCDEPVKGRGFCPKHYERVRLHGDPHKVLKPRGLPVTQCAAPGCQELRQRRDWCLLHYGRWLATGDVQSNKPSRVFRWAESANCRATDCKNPVKCRWLCMKHYQHYWRLAESADSERRAARRERNRRAAAARFAKDPEPRRAAYRRWVDQNRAKVCASAALRRSRLKIAAQIPFSPEQLAARMRYWGDQCWICGGPFEAVDHVKPVSKGGAHILANLRPICRTDNSRKRAAWPYSAVLTIAGI